MNGKAIFERLAAWGDAFNPEVIGGTQALYAPLVARPAEANVTRDIAYGPDERHRLDVFAPGGGPAPVLMFVHGGGFIMGDKGGPDAPFHNNIGAWAIKNGFVGVTLTYRLAPKANWPAGGEDVAAAVAWVADNIAAHGGDPSRIFVMGQSAGATHVADLVANAGVAAGRFAGALMISGIYDLAIADHSDMHRAYYGSDETRWAACSTLDRLAGADIPCFYSVSEWDPLQFQRQAAALVNARVAAKGAWPEMHWLPGHNHLSSVSQMGSAHDTLGPLVRAFILRHG